MPPSLYHKPSATERAPAPSDGALLWRPFFFPTAEIFDVSLISCRCKLNSVMVQSSVERIAVYVLVQIRVAQPQDHRIWFSEPSLGTAGHKNVTRNGLTFELDHLAFFPINIMISHRTSSFTGHSFRRCENASARARESSIN
jgi:hypothetical protein